MKNINKRVIAGGLLLLLGSRVEAQAPSNRNAVFIGGTPIARIRTGVAGYSPVQRAAAMQERLNRILALGPIQSSDITVTGRGSDAAVRVQGRLLFTETKADGRAAQTTALVLANQLAGRMRAVLPELTKAK